MKLLLTIFAVLLLLTGCGAEDAPTYRQVSSDEAAAMMASESDYLILDVRTREEYEQGHIPGAVCVPNESIGSGELSALPRKDQLILVYCRSGNRSKQAAQKLADAGYTNIVEFGGILSWTGETVSGSEGE
ncbi:MAG: rhodanese-like domain-containing protein [Clostridiales bacterium]|nr:rhodanese-like domain-containing protein [Clostridiales bacterium]